MSSTYTYIHNYDGPCTVQGPVHIHYTYIHTYDGPCTVQGPVHIHIFTVTSKLVENIIVFITFLFPVQQL